MNRLINLSVGVFCCLLVSHLAAQDLDPRTTRIDQFLTDGIANGFSGSVIVIDKSTTLLAKGYGFAHKPSKKPNSLETVFDIGSNTKQFTSAAILKLVEQGRINLQQPITDFFKDIPTDKASITIHHLLTHSSGFVETIDSDFSHIPAKDLFKRLFSTKLLFTPGTQYSYSNIGYSVLAKIIEISSGQDYETFLQQQFFKPLKMQQTGYLMPRWHEAKLANGYPRGVMDSGTMVERYQTDNKVSWNLLGNGGINSTPKDMLIWMRALANNQVLSQKSKDKLLGLHQKIKDYNDGRELYSGYGWGVFKKHESPLRVSHNGSNGRFWHSIIWYPELDRLILYATNADSPQLERVPSEIDKMLLDEKYQAAPIRKNPYLFAFDFIRINPPANAKKLLHLIGKEYPRALQEPAFLNRIGLLLMRQKQNEWSISLLYQNTLLFTDDGNLFDSLGEAYLQDGQTKEAAASFQKALLLGQNNDCYWCENSQTKLDQLSKK